MVEDDFCRILAEGFCINDELVKFVLLKAGIPQEGSSFRVLKDEQIEARPKTSPKNWWRHWWCKVPETGRESETDVFVVLEDEVTSARVALHVEVKYGASLSLIQASDYRSRASYMSDKTRYLDYTQSAVLFIAPRKAIDTYKEFHKFFDGVISFEELEVFLPEFAVR